MKGLFMSTPTKSFFNLCGQSHIYLRYTYVTSAILHLKIKCITGNDNVTYDMYNDRDATSILGHC